MSELQLYYCHRCLKEHRSSNWIFKRTDEGSEEGHFCASNEELPWMLRLFEPNPSEDYPA